MQTYAYPASLEPGDTAGVTVVTFPDLPEAITEGTGPAEARAMAADALGMVLLAYLREGRALPAPSAGREMITPNPEVAAKLAVIEAFRAAGISRSELARRLGRDEKEARRILDPTHRTKLQTLAAALAVLDRRLVIGVEAA